MASLPLNNTTDPNVSNEADALDKSDIELDCRGKCMTKFQGQSDTAALFLLLLCCWAIGYSLFGNIVGLDSQMFSLVVSNTIFLVVRMRSTTLNLLI